MPFKILHSSDWHLGKKLFKHPREDEQRFFLSWLFHTIQAEQADALLISGDIFDVPNPPAEAVKMYFDFLADVALHTRCQVHIISGNHDSGRFIEAPHHLLERQRIHVSGQLSACAKSLNYLLTNDEGLKVRLTHFPYFRAHELWNIGRELGLSLDSSIDADPSEQALICLKALLNHLWHAGLEADVHILLGHHLFGHFSLAGSELGLSLSGLESLPLSIFEKYDYLALGHIHRPQTVGKGRPLARYPGAPMAFRFSEKHSPSVTRIEISSDKKINMDTIPIPLSRQLLTVRGKAGRLIEQLQQVLVATPKSELPHFIHVEAIMDSPDPQLHEKVREIITSSGAILTGLSVEYENGDWHEELEEGAPPPDLFVSTEDLFKKFYHEKYPHEAGPSGELMRDFHALLELQRSQASERSLQDFLA